MAGTDLKNRLTLWEQVLLHEEELNDRQQRLEALKGFLADVS